MRAFITLLLLAFPALAAPCDCPDSCRTTTNIASWFGKGRDNTALDDRPGEYGYHTPTGDWVAVEFREAPKGSRVRIDSFSVDHYGTFTGRDKADKSKAAAVILSAVHTKEACDPYATVPPSSCDVWLWTQTPVGAYGAWRHHPRLEGGLLPGKTVWLKQAMFANPDGREMLVEMTVEWKYCFEGGR